MCVHIIRLSCNYIRVYTCTCMCTFLAVNDIEKVKENSCLNEKVCACGTCSVLSLAMRNSVYIECPCVLYTAGCITA